MDEIKPVAWVERTGGGLTRMWSSDLSAWAERPASPEPLYDQQAIDTLRAEVEDSEGAARVWRRRCQEAEARAERAEAEARRWRFCIERDVMPVVASDGKTWCMFVSVTSRRRSLFTGKSPAEAVDAAIDAAKQGAE